MSTIKVDTYLTRGGASEIAIDKLKGASSAGSMTVVGEGGTTTTNLQQGLAKSWNHYDQNTGNDIRDSFNVSSVTDNTTGQMKTTFTNAMNNKFYSVNATVEDGGYGGIGYIGTSGDPANDATEMGTTLIEIQVRNNSGATPAAFDPDCAMIQVLGDLA